MATAKKKTAGRRAGTKSSAIREYMKANPEAGPTAITAALKAKGIEITPAHVSNVKAAMLKKQAKAAGGNGAARRKPGRPSRKAAGQETVSLGALIEARKFAAQVGGVDSAVTLLQSLAKLQ